MIVLLIRFNIFTSGNAVIAGERPMISPVLLRNLGTMNGISSKPPSDNIICVLLHTYTEANGIFTLSRLVISRVIRGVTICNISTGSSGFFLNTFKICSPTFSSPNLCTAALAEDSYFRYTVSTMPCKSSCM